jgi:hypothetical protein
MVAQVHAIGIPVGCSGRGAQDSSIERPVSLAERPIEEQFRLMSETGAFDYFDRLPPEDQLDEYLNASAKYKLPFHTASWSYKLGRDEALLARNIARTREIGAKMHNIMIYSWHGDGRPVTDAEIVDCYLKSYDAAMRIGVEPTFELHVNMWNEDFRRVTPVALEVQKRGIQFNFTLDYSHAIFKIGNPEELDRSGVRADVESGRLILDPFEDGNLCDEWLNLGIVRWLQVRSVAPNGPKNVWTRFDSALDVAAIDKEDPTQWRKDGDPGRGILYPFKKPKPGEWHSPWYAYNLEPTKEVVRKVLRYHKTDQKKRLSYITTEMINLPDYAHNARFSLMEENAEIARFVRATWTEIQGSES